ncbi:MAG: hypothetical protein Q4Q13_05980, partial [Vagococcus sp.]|nr:hypothetical protein [Vagococcus sp.]
MRRLKTKRCSICGSIFQSRSGVAKYCSEECSAEGKRRLQRERYRKLIPCSVCGKKFKENNDGICSNECRELARKFRWYVLKVRYFYPKENGYTDWKILKGIDIYDALNRNGYEDVRDESVYIPHKHFVFSKKEQAEECLKGIKTDPDFLKNIYPEIKERIEKIGLERFKRQGIRARDKMSEELNISTGDIDWYLYRAYSLHLCTREGYKNLY